MKKLLTILLILVTYGLMAENIDHESLILEANEHYNNGEYDIAIEIYNEVLDSGHEAAGLYFNIGNSYYKLKQIPQALLNYERAKLLAPKDEDILFNLELAQMQIVDEIEVLPEFFITTWFNNIISTLTSNVWAIISIASFIVSIVLISIFIYSGNMGLKKLSFVFSVVIFISSITTFIFSYKQKRTLIDQDYAIVFSPSVTAKSSPDEKGTDLFLIHEGTKVKIEDEIEGWNKTIELNDGTKVKIEEEIDIWYEIKLSDGKVGWVKSEVIEII